MNILQLKEPKNTFLVTITSLIVITIIVYYFLYCSSTNSGALNFEYFKNITIGAVIIKFFIIFIITLSKWLDSKHIIGRFNVLLFKYRLTLFIGCVIIYFIIKKIELNINIDPWNRIIYIFTWIASTYIVGHLIWTKRFKSKFNENLSPNEDLTKPDTPLYDSKTPLALTSVEDFPIPTNNVTVFNVIQENHSVIECLYLEECTNIQTNKNIENQCIDLVNQEFYEEFGIKLSEERILKLYQKYEKEIAPESKEDFMKLLRNQKISPRIKWIGTSGKSPQVTKTNLVLFAFEFTDTKNVSCSIKRKILNSFIRNNFSKFENGKETIFNKNAIHNSINKLQR